MTGAAPALPDDLPPPPPGYTLIGTPTAPPSAPAQAPAAVPSADELIARGKAQGREIAPDEAAKMRQDLVAIAARNGGAGVQPLPADLPPPPPGYTVINPPSGQTASVAPRSRPFPPPLGDTAQQSAGFWTNLRASLAPDVNDQIRRFAATRFPSIPINDAVQRYGVVNGHIVYADDKGNVARETPSVVGEGRSPMDELTRAGDYVASSVGPAIPGAVGAAVGTAMGPTPASIPAAAGAAAVTDVGRQALDRWLAGDKMSIDFLNSAGQGALAGGGQAIGVLGAKLATSNPLGVATYDRLAAQEPAAQQAAADLEAEAKARGVDLSAGQVSNLRSVMARERQLGRYPETADLIHDFTQTQRNEQIPAAVRSEIGKISATPPGETAVGQFREGAGAVLGGALDERAAQAAESYATALDGPASAAGVRTPRPPYTDDGLNALMKRPAMQAALKQASIAAQNRGIPATELGITEFNAAGDPVYGGIPSWRGWDYIKRGLDDVIDAGKNPLTGRFSDPAAAAQGIKQQMLATLDKVNPDYLAARLQFGSASETVKDMLDGGLGILAKLKEAAPLDRQAVVRRIFDAGSLTPEEVGRMRAGFALAGRQADWNAGVATWLSDVLDDSIKGAGRNGNMPGQLYQRVWQDPRQRTILQVALGGDAARVDGIEKLMQVVNASARGLPEGSPTVTDAMATMSDAGKMIGRGARVLGKLASPDTYLDLGNQAVEGLAALRAPGKRIALTQALLGGDVAPALRRLSLLSPTEGRAIGLASQIMTQLGFKATGARTPSDFAPPVLSAPPAAPQSP